MTIIRVRQKRVIQWVDRLVKSGRDRLVHSYGEEEFPVGTQWALCLRKWQFLRLPVRCNSDSVRGNEMICWRMIGQKKRGLSQPQPDSFDQPLGAPLRWILLKRGDRVSTLVSPTGHVSGLALYSTPCRCTAKIILTHLKAAIHKCENVWKKCTTSSVIN